MKRRNLANVVGVAAAWALFTYSSQTLAGGQWSLNWTAPEGCPQGPQVLARVRDIVGDNLAQTAELKAIGRIVKVESGYRLELRIEHDGGERERSLEAKACEDLLGASAVVLGLHLREVATEEAAVGDEAAGSLVNAEPKLTPRQTAAAPPVQTEPEDGATTRHAGRGSSYVWLALPQVSLAVGSLPKSSWLLGAGVGVRLHDWGLWLAGRYQDPQTVADSTVPNVVATIDRYSAEFGVSNGWSGRHGQIAPGVFVGVDHVVARGSGRALEAARAAKTFAYLGAGVTLRWFATDWLALAANVCGEVPLSRPRFVVDSLGEIEQVAPVHLRLGLGSEWNL